MPESTMLIFGPESQPVRVETDVLSEVFAECASMLVLGSFNAERVEHLATRVGEVTMADPDLTSKRVAALEVPDGITVATFGPENIEADDGSFDAVVMVDALYQVPAMLMEAGMTEICRVLRQDGLLYVSEPVFEGPFNDLTVLVQDDERERLAAFETLRGAIQAGQFELAREIFFKACLNFGGFDEFAAALLQPRPGFAPASPSLLDQVRPRFEAHRGADGRYLLEAPRRVDLLRKVL